MKSNGRDSVEFRLAYPPGGRPEFQLEKPAAVCAVIDASQSGLKFVLPKSSLQVGDVVRGIVKFHEGRSAEVLGRIVRIEDSACAAALTRRIPKKTMMEEQRYLLQNYKR
jgi:hypothetical protein